MRGHTIMSASRNNAQAVGSAGTVAATNTGAPAPHAPSCPCVPSSPCTPIAYLYDGTLEGLLSALALSYERKEYPEDVIRKEAAQPRIGQALLEVETNWDNVLAMKRKLVSTCGYPTFRTLVEAALSDEPAAGQALFRFMRFALIPAKGSDCFLCKRQPHCTGTCTVPKRKLLNYLTHPLIEPVLRLQRHVLNERHHMLQFIRFEKWENGIYFARCNPNAAVIPLLMDWFSERFNTQPFIIYDEVHNMAGIHDGSTWYLVKGELANIPRQSSEETLIRNAWKQFYRALAIDARYNPELRRQFMPKRFWKNIVEMQEDIPADSLRVRCGK